MLAWAICAGTMVLLQVTSPATRADMLYSATSLSGLPGFYPADVNDSGQIAGILTVPAGASDTTGHAAILSHGVLTDLGSFGGSWSKSIAINASGQVVVNVGTAAGERAFLNSSGTAHDLGTLDYFRPSTQPNAINSSGQVVGSTTSAANNAFLYSNGVLRELRVPDGDFSRAFAINDAGQIVGAYRTRSGADHAFLYSGGAMHDLGTLPGDRVSYATGISSDGKVVGHGWNAGFLYDGGKMIDLGSQFNSYLMVNSLGQVVSEDSPWIYDHGRVADLNSLLATPLGDVRLHGALRIDDAGDIWAYGIDAQGVYNTYLLKPTAVPEPGALALLIGGIATMAVARRRRRALLTKP